MIEYPKVINCFMCDGTGLKGARRECRSCFGYGCRVQEAEDLSPRLLFSPQQGDHS